MDSDGEFIIFLMPECDKFAVEMNFMYRRPILCTLYGAVDSFNVLKKYIMYLYVLVICDIMSL